MGDGCRKGSCHWSGKWCGQRCSNWRYRTDSQMSSNWCHGTDSQRSSQWSSNWCHGAEDWSSQGCSNWSDQWSCEWCGDGGNRYGSNWCNHGSSGDAIELSGHHLATGSGHHGRSRCSKDGSRCSKDGSSEWSVQQTWLASDTGNQSAEDDGLWRKVRNMLEIFHVYYAVATQSHNNTNEFEHVDLICCAVD